MRSERIHILNKAPIRQGKYVLYRMQASQRLNCNLALCEAARLANETGLPLLILFHLKANYPDANYRHFKFMAEGLTECVAGAQRAGIGFELTDLPQELLAATYYAQAAAIVCDRGYLRHQKAWNEDIALHAPCLTEEVEDNLIVPIASATHKAEWSARTIRPKLMAKLPYFITDAGTPLPRLHHAYPSANDHNRETLTRFLEVVRCKAYLAPVEYPGGEQAAVKTLEAFILNKLPLYSERRSDPAQASGSRLSAYLHFGQISPLQILQRISSLPDSVVFTEQLLVRRELSHNFVHYTPGYDTYGALPNWCRQTLQVHSSDTRPYIYTTEQLENSRTHDPFWNAAMNEMRRTGYMENTMRMYWGKKIIEWSATPEEAYITILQLNNRYFTDGRDANSYASIGWCFGLHDRPWPSHPIFGTVRTMTASGLSRKYSMDAYCRKWLSTFNS